MLSWVESIRIELNCSTPSWYLRITCKLLELSVKHLPLKKKKNKFGDITACLTLRDSLLSLFSCLVQSKSLQPHGLQHARLPCSSLFPGVCSNSCPLSQRCYPTISSSVVHFSSCPQSFPESGSFPLIWVFTSGGQSIGASALSSVLPMNIQG